MKNKNKYKYHANKKPKRQAKPPKQQKPQKRDLAVQFQNLVDNGGLAHKYITEQEALFFRQRQFQLLHTRLNSGTNLICYQTQSFL